MYSFRTHADGSITWVPHRRDPPAQAPQRKNCEDEASPEIGEPSKRAQKSIERARKHRERMEKVARFRCACALRHWVHATALHAVGSGASAAPQPRLRETGDGIPGAVAACSDGDSAIPSRRINEGDAAPPQRDEAAAHACVGGHGLSVPPELGERSGDACAAEKRAHASPAAGALSPVLRAPAKARRALALAGAEPPDAAAEGQRAQDSVPVHAVHACTMHVAPHAPMQPPCHEPGTPCGGLWQGPPGATPCDAQHAEQVLAQLRMHEYPSFMSYHMRQGVPQEEACRRWQAYERARMAGYGWVTD